MSEYSLQKQVCDWMKLQHPNVLFRSDHSGVRVSIGTAKKMKALQPKEPYNEGYPDLLIIKKRRLVSGLYIELKVKELIGVYKVGEKKGQAMYKIGKTSPSQLLWLDYLRKEGFATAVVFGYDQAIKIIEQYLNN